MEYQEVRRRIMRLRGTEKGRDIEGIEGSKLGE
jgi:hypothetical protein